MVFPLHPPPPFGDSGYTTAENFPNVFEIAFRHLVSPHRSLALSVGHWINIWLGVITIIVVTDIHKRIVSIWKLIINSIITLCSKGRRRQRTFSQRTAECTANHYAKIHIDHYFWVLRLYVYIVQNYTDSMQVKMRGQFLTIFDTCPGAESRTWLGKCWLQTKLHGRDQRRELSFIDEPICSGLRCMAVTVGQPVCRGTLGCRKKFQGSREKFWNFKIFTRRKW